MRDAGSPHPSDSAPRKPAVLEGAEADGDDRSDRSETNTTSSSDSATCTVRAGGIDSPFCISGDSSTPPPADADADEGGSSTDADAYEQAGGLTPAVISLLRITPAVAHGAAPELVDELSADLHMSARQGPPASRTLLHALSKESLDVLRAERIARRMAREAARLEQGSGTSRDGATSPLLVVKAVNDVCFDMDSSASSPSHKKHGKAKSARATRVYMPIAVAGGHEVSPLQRQGAGEQYLRAHCELVSAE